MPNPIDYSLGDVPDPTAPFMQGIQAGAGIRALGLQQQQQDLVLQQQQQALQAQQQQRQAIMSVISNPNASGADYARLAMILPKDQAEQALKSWDAMNKDQQQNSLQDLGRVISAIASGRPDLGSEILRDRGALIAKSGGNANEAKVLGALADWVDLHPESARATLGMHVANVPGGKEMLDNLVAANKEGREAQKFPIEVRKSKADADAAESDAKSKAVAAKYAEQLTVADLQKKAADLGLTRAQTTQAIALGKKYGAETQKILLELATGDPAKTFDAERNLRKEYTDQTKGYVETVEGYRRVKSAKDNAVGDLSLIYGYMKMLDPGSVVREGEFATAQNAAGVPERIMNVYNRVARGERLTPNQRAEFIGQAGEVYAAARKRESEVRSGLSTVIRNYKLNPENIFGVGAAEEPKGPAAQRGSAPAAAAAAAPGEVTATNPATGQRIVFRGGKWAPL